MNISSDDPIWGKNLTLSVNTSGHVVHAFVNGESIGNYGYGFCLSSKVDYIIQFFMQLLHCTVLCNCRIYTCRAWTFRITVPPKYYTSAWE